MIRVDNWRRRILEEFNTSSESGFGSDVILKMNEEVIYTHRLFLGALSSYFRGIFHSLPEEEERPLLIVLDLPQSPFPRLKPFLLSIMEERPPQRPDNELATFLRIDHWPFHDFQIEETDDILSQMHSFPSFSKMSNTLHDIEDVEELIESENLKKKCPLCKLDILLHKAYEGADTLSCCECGLESLFTKQLVIHLESVHLKLARNWACSLCSKDVGSHSTKENGSKNVYKCCFCFRSYDKFLKLREHSLSHIEKKFKCLTCGKGFSHSRTFKNHLDKEHGPDSKLYQLNCPYVSCTFVTKYNQTLSSHMKEVHEGLKRSHQSGDSNNAIRCPHCSKSFKHRYFTQYHLKVCSENASRIVYKCKECGKSGFANKDTLKNHIRAIHTKESPFECEICEAGQRPRYATLMALKTHISRKHGLVPSPSESKRLHPCNLCGKLLSSASSLKSHKKVVHEKNRGYSCSFCDKHFSSKSNLQIHEGSIHTGILPYKCEDCSKSFNRKSSYLEHMNKFHGNSNLQKQESAEADFLRISTT